MSKQNSRRIGNHDNKASTSAGKSSQPLPPQAPLSLSNQAIAQLGEQGKASSGKGIEQSAQQAFDHIVQRSMGVNQIQRKLKRNDARQGLPSVHYWQHFTQRRYARHRKRLLNSIARIEAAEAQKAPNAGVVLGHYNQLQTRIEEAQAYLDAKDGNLSVNEQALQDACSYATGEIEKVLEHWRYLQGVEAELAEADNVDNIDKLLSIKNVLRRPNYIAYDGLNKLQNNLVERIRRDVDAWKAGKSEDQINYGDAVHGEIEEGKLDEYRSYAHDFDRMTKIMDNRSLVLELLQPLAEAIDAELPKLEDMSGANDEERREALGKEALALLQKKLSAAEKAAGFNEHPVVPMGILPAETFLGLIEQGYILDDYGAGIVHGEMAHRLQWYAFKQAIDQGKPDENWNHADILDLYQRMNAFPFANLRTGGGASTWGSVVDRQVTTTRESYGYPGTFTRDLLEVGAGGEDAFKGIVRGHMEDKEVEKAWPARNNAPAAEELAPLASIGMGLMQQVKERLRAADAVGKKYDWTGVHPEEAEAEFKAGLLEGGEYEDSGQEYLRKK